MASPTNIREHSPLAILTDPKRDIPLGEIDIRVDDYLNDKIQTTADLKDLESLIAKVEEQKVILQTQLQDVQSQLSEAKLASTNQSSAMLELTQEFQRQQESVQKRLMIVTSSDSPKEATRRMKAPLEKLHKVELTNNYVELLKDVEELKKQAREHLPADPKGALVPYTRLKELAVSLQQLQDPAEGAAIHLVNHVLNTSSELWTEMKKIMSDEFEAVLQNSKWPDTESEPTREWSECFEKLLDLQGPELVDARGPVVLLPMAVLVKTFVMQFKYHFFSDKPTNHPHQLGDYFFEWFLGTVSKWEGFLQENVGPVLAAHFRGNALAGNSIFIDPVAAFITALIPVLKDKVDSLLIQVADEPQYLSRFILQIMAFDDKLETQFNYDGGNTENGWKGLSWSVLDVWFDRWMTVEKDFAWKRYKEIIEKPDSDCIDYDSATAGKTKATYAALQVADLIVTVTVQYKHVRRFGHKIKFLIDIQAEILDDYVKNLKDYINTFETYSSTIGRTVLGITAEQREKVEGINGLDRLCRVYCSAEYIITMCKDWSNEEFFVDLWDELQSRAQNGDRRENFTGQMSFDEVKDAISSAVGTEDTGSVFDETIENYRKLVQKSEELIVRTLRLSVQQDEAVKFLEKALSSRAFKGIRRQVALSSSNDRDDVVMTSEEEEAS